MYSGDWNIEDAFLGQKKPSVALPAIGGSNTRKQLGPDSMKRHKPSYLSTGSGASRGSNRKSSALGSLHNSKLNNSPANMYGGSLIPKAIPSYSKYEQDYQTKRLEGIN